MSTAATDRKRPQDAIYWRHPVRQDLPEGVTWRPTAWSVVDQVANERVRRALDALPADGHIYNLMISFSKGHATATASRINNGSFGAGYQAQAEPQPSEQYPDTHVLLVKRQVTPAGE